MTLENVIMVALVVGIILGFIMIVSAVYIYVKDPRKFGVGGIVLVVFGFILTGLSVWSSIQVSVTKDGVAVEGELKALRQQIDLQQEQIKAQSEALTNIEANVEETANLADNVKTFETEIQVIQEKIDNQNQVLTDIQQDVTSSRNEIIELNNLLPTLPESNRNFASP